MIAILVIQDKWSGNLRTIRRRNLESLVTPLSVAVVIAAVRIAVVHPIAREQFVLMSSTMI